MTVKNKSTKQAPKKAGKKVAAQSGKKASPPAPRKVPARASQRLREPDPLSDAALLALSRDYEAGPDMPVKVAQLEYASLARLGQSAAPSLAKVGITPLHSATLGRFAKRLGLLEVGWQKARTGVALLAADRKRVAEADELKAQLLTGGRWACRKDTEALDELSRIADGSGLADTIADLRELVAFWEAHPSERRHTDITPKSLLRAVALADQLDRAAEKESSDLDAAAAFALRNRCFWAADELAKEIREGGRYAFRLQPKMAAKFVSRYRAAVVRRSRSKAKDEPAPVPTPTV